MFIYSYFPVSSWYASVNLAAEILLYEYTAPEEVA